MHVHMITVGMFQSNCFIVSCEDTGEAIVIDAGDDADRILSYIESKELRVKMIVNTHAHIDHIAALHEVASKLKVPVWMHKDEMVIYENLASQAMMFGLPDPKTVIIDRFLKAGDKVSFGKLSGEVVHTPGHSPGGITLVFRDEKPPVAFVGDVLFQGSIGRIDLPGADQAQMVDTLKNVCMKLPDDMIVYSGHGPETTIGHEKETNPFLLQLRD